MTFKKKKLVEKNISNLQKRYIKTIKKNKIFGLLFGFISVSSILYGAIYSLDYISSIEFDIPDIGINTSVINIEKEGKIKEINNEINILLLGRGGGNHDAPLLTDTIILAKINYEKGYISMFSVPRDFYVEYDEDSTYKINELYMRNYYDTLDTEKASEKIMNKISQITGEKIENYINVDFNGFIKIIDSIGGIKITLDKTFVDNQYPDNNWGYTTFILKKGTWTIDGSVALKYARSRHSTSDFDRSLRQQTIINSVKEKILSLGFLTSPTKMKSLYNSIKDNIETNLSVNEVINLLMFTKDINKDDIYTSNLNDSCYYGSDKCVKGGFLYVPFRSDFNNQSVLLAYGTDKTNLNNYSSIQKYTDIVFNSPEIFKEKYQINVFNSTKLGGVATDYAEYLKKYGFNIPSFNSVGNARDKEYEKTTVFYNNIDEDSVTLKVLKKFIFGPIIKTELPVYSNDLNTKIEIIVGDDYKYLDN